MSVKYFTWLRAVEDTCAWDIPVGVFCDLDHALLEANREWTKKGRLTHEWYVDTYIDNVAAERRSVYNETPVPISSYDIDAFDSEIRTLAHEYMN